MKKIFLILFTIIGFGINTNAQDIIILKNGDEIQAVVQEIGKNDIKYKKFENLNGPFYMMEKAEIFMIKYENGSKDVFVDFSESAATNIRLLSDPYKFRLYVGSGVGVSYGFFGTSLEARFNRFAIHSGIGMWMDGFHWVTGAKWYFWKNLYCNSTIGSMNTYDEYYYDNPGPNVAISELFGANWSWGGNVRFGVNFGLGLCYDFYHREFGNVFDIGLSISFGTK